MSCAWQPARSVGGDYFDVLALAPGQITVYLADVSGKAIAAALLMGSVALHPAPNTFGGPTHNFVIL